MHWILQSNFEHETGWDTLVETLDRFSIPYSIHKVIPFIGELIPSVESINKNAICIGSYSMRHTAKSLALSPGVFDLFDMDFTVQKLHWDEFLLNYDSTIMKFEDVDFEGLKFIRPIHDSKYFAGRLFDNKEFKKWKIDVANAMLDYSGSLTLDTLVQISEPKEIYEEYRIWVVKGEIVTSSLYKRGNKVIYDNRVPDEIHHFAKKMIDIWSPHDAFVIDVCTTSKGMRIVEINTLNSCGFYAGDVQKLVFALESAFST